MSIDGFLGRKRIGKSASNEPCGVNGSKSLVIRVLRDKLCCRSDSEPEELLYDGLWVLLRILNHSL